MFTIAVPLGRLDGLAAKVAIDKGFFDKEGVEVTASNYETADDLAALIRGEVDFGYTSPQQLAKIVNDGVSLRSVHPIAINSCHLLVASDSRYRELKDLEGKKIGLVGWESTSSTSFQILAKKLTGLNKADFKYEIAEPPELIRKLEDGDIQATVLWEPTLTEVLLTDKFRSILGPFADVWTDSKQMKGKISIAMLTTRKDILDRNSKEATKVVAAYRKSIRYIMQNSPEVINGYESYVQAHSHKEKRAVARVLKSGSSFTLDYSKSVIEAQYNFIELAAKLGVVVTRKPRQRLYYRIVAGRLIGE